jgi:hypothetical protein
MNTKTIVVELTGEEDFPLEVEWSYTKGTPSFGRVAPFNAKDDEAEIIIPSDLEQQLITFALGTLVPRWIKEVERQVGGLECSGLPRFWQEYLDDTQNCEREDREER